MSTLRGWYVIAPTHTFLIPSADVEPFLEAYRNWIEGETRKNTPLLVRYCKHCNYPIIKSEENQWTHLGLNGVRAACFPGTTKSTVAEPRGEV